MQNNIFKSALLLCLAIVLMASPVASAQAKKYKPKHRNQHHNACRKNIDQGLAGTIYLLEGNFMPSPGGKSGGTTKAVQRTLEIYPLTKQSDAGGTFHPRPATKPVFRGQSCEDGSFKIGLAPGRYSVFVVVDKKLFANGTDADGYIQPVTITKGNTTLLDLKINNKAVY
jgi:hypothetical protein